MVPPGIEPGSCPRQGHILAVGLWDHLTFHFYCKKCLKSLFHNLIYGKERTGKRQWKNDLVFS